MAKRDLTDIQFELFAPKRVNLSNGLPIYIFDNKDMEITYLRIIFSSAGYLYQDKYFVAGLCSSLLSTYTKDYPNNTISEQLDYYGVQYSHSSNSESAEFTFSFLSKYSKNVISLIEQILLYPIFDQEQKDILIKKNKQDFALREQRTAFLANKTFMQKLFGEGNPYGNYAQKDDYDKVTVSDLSDFYQRAYLCNRCYIIACGKVDDIVLKDLDNSFGSIAHREDSFIKVRDSQVDNLMTHLPKVDKQTIYYTNKDSAKQASIVMGKFMPKFDSEDYIPLRILNCIFGGYFNSRLMTNIREDKGYTYGIDSGIAPYKYGSIMVIGADLDPKHDTDTIEQINKEIDILQRQPISKEELFMVKNYLIGQLLSSLDGVIDKGESYNTIIRYKLKDDYNQLIAQKIKSCSAEDILNLANKYLNKDEFIISIAKQL